MFEKLYPYIERFVFKKELRDKIIELRKNDNIREEAYQKLKKNILFKVKLSVAFLLLLFISMVMLGFPLIMILSILAVFAFLLSLSLSHRDGGKPAYYYNIGIPEIATITGFHFNLSVHSFSIDYEIKKNGKSWTIKDGYQRDLLREESFDKHPDFDRSKISIYRPLSIYRRLSKGYQILVFIRESFFKTGMVYFPNHFEQYCLDKKKYKEIHEFIDKHEGLVNV